MHYLLYAFIIAAAAFLLYLAWGMSILRKYGTTVPREKLLLMAERFSEGRTKGVGFRLISCEGDDILAAVRFSDKIRASVFDTEKYGYIDRILKETDGSLTIASAQFTVNQTLFPEIIDRISVEEERLRGPAGFMWEHEFSDSLLGREK